MSREVALIYIVFVLAEFRGWPVLERSELLHKARSSSSGLKQQYQFRRKKLIEDRAKLLQVKQASLLRLQEKKVREKENLTKAVMKFGFMAE